MKNGIILLRISSFILEIFHFNFANEKSEVINICTRSSTKTVKPLNQEYLLNYYSHDSQTWHQMYIRKETE